MPFGISEMDVPEGQKKIAQRFNAGMYATPVKVPKGRLKHGNNRSAFGRPFGTRIQSTTIPALKRRAIIGTSLRDTVPLNFRKALWLGVAERRLNGAALVDPSTGARRRGMVRRSARAKAHGYHRHRAPRDQTGALRSRSSSSSTGAKQSNQP